MAASYTSVQGHLEYSCQGPSFKMQFVLKKSWEIIHSCKPKISLQSGFVTTFYNSAPWTLI